MKNFIALLLYSSLSFAGDCTIFPKVYYPMMGNEDIAQQFSLRSSGWEECYFQARLLAREAFGFTLEEKFCPLKKPGYILLYWNYKGANFQESQGIVNYYTQTYDDETPRRGQVIFDVFGETLRLDSFGGVF